MKKRIITFPLALAMALALSPAAFAAAPEGGSGPGASSGPALVTEEHVSYIHGTGSGDFSPKALITRGEAAVMLSRLLAERVPVTAGYTDVPESSWYYDAALQLGSLGVIRPGEAAFRGGDVISRGEFVRYVAAFFPLRTDGAQFPDVDPDDENAAAILSARAYGWLKGYSNGNVGPDDPLDRCEAVAILNRALGRPGDSAAIDAGRPALYLDIAPGAWYYYDVMEATVPHGHVSGADGEVWTSWTEADTGLPAGFRTEGAHLLNGWSYYYDSSAKDILRGRSKNGFTAGADGRFTSGDSGVDKMLREIILRETGAAMEREDMLRELFGYCRDSYSYLGRNNHVPVGDTGFTLSAAKAMLETGKGNCYNFASVFYYLSRWIGYDTKAVSGRLGINTRSGGGWQDHAWTEIDGYIYDPQLEWRQVHGYHRSNYMWYFYHFKDDADYWMYRK